MVRVDKFGRRRRLEARDYRILVLAAIITLLIGFLALTLRESVPEDAKQTKILVAGTVANTILLGLLVFVNSDLTRASDRMAGASTDIRAIEKNRFDRDSPRFRVASFAGPNPFLTKRAGDTVDVDFEIINDGHRGSALWDCWITSHHEDREALAAMTVQRISRRGQPSGYDYWIRPGDRVAFAGRVELPHTFQAATGIKFVFHARPVLDSPEARGATHLPFVAPT